MRQFFTLRFWLTLLALAGLALAVAAFARSRDSGGDDDAVAVGEATTERKIDLVAWVYAVQPPPGFEMVNGRANKDFPLIIDGTRTMIVTAGTPGEIDCPRLTELAQCTVAADLLGDGVLWFSIVPGVPGATVQLPAVAELLDGGWVRLANDWVVRHAPKVDRSCPESSTSLTDFIDTYGDEATSTFNFAQQELVKVTCPRQLEQPATTVATLPVTTIDPLAPVDPLAPIDPSAPIDPAATVVGSTVGG